MAIFLSSLSAAGAEEEPLGLAVGNAVEMEQSIRILQGEKGPDDFMRVLEALAGWMIYLGGQSRTPAELAAHCLAHSLLSGFHVGEGAERDAGCWFGQDFGVTIDSFGSA